MKTKNKNCGDTGEDLRENTP